MSQTLTGPTRAYYQFNSCTRKKIERYGHKTLSKNTKKAQKSGVLKAEQSLPGACNAIKSRAGCVRIYWAVGRSGTQMQLKTSPKRHQHFLNGVGKAFQQNPTTSGAQNHA